MEESSKIGVSEYFKQSFFFPSKNENNYYSDASKKLFHLEEI